MKYCQTCFKHLFKEGFRNYCQRYVPNKYNGALIIWTHIFWISWITVNVILLWKYAFGITEYWRLMAVDCLIEVTTDGFDYICEEKHLREYTVTKCIRHYTEDKVFSWEHTSTIMVAWVTWYSKVNFWPLVLLAATFHSVVTECWIRAANMIVWWFYKSIDNFIIQYGAGQTDTPL